MHSSTASYRRHRFPPEIISHAVWLHYRFCLSFRDVEDLLAERGITVTYETIRHWCRKFGTEYARRLKRRVVIGAPHSASAEDYSRVKAPNPGGWSPTSSRATVRRGGTPCGVRRRVPAEPGAVIFDRTQQLALPKLG